MKITVWDQDTNEIIDMEISIDALDSMEKAEQKYRDRLNAALKEDDFYYSDEI